jgi:mRNA interferase RelE/StbE
MEIRIRKSAIKDLNKIGNKEREKISLRIQESQKFPNVQNIRKLTNFEPAWTGSQEGLGGLSILWNRLG